MVVDERKNEKAANFAFQTYGFLGQNKLKTTINFNCQSKLVCVYSTLDTNFACNTGNF